ncbi:hypothetical protein V8E36_002035 [Tilletia maclaganii]
MSDWSPSSPSALLILAEETYQAFLIPAFLLYCSDVFGYNQLQEGYLISILQGSRALWLALIFPRLLGWARGFVSRRAERRWHSASQNSEQDERSPLLSSNQNGTSSSPSADREHHGKGAEAAKNRACARLDMLVLLFSYALSILAFLLIASTRKYAKSGISSSFFSLKKGDGDGNSDGGPKGDAANGVGWWLLITGIVLLQLASGFASVRTTLIVDAASAPAARQRLGSGTAAAESNADPTGDGLAQQDGDGHGGDQGVQGEEGDKCSTSTAESLALAANQMLITFTTALMPILTSLVYSRGLQAQPHALPEAVWIFKAAVGALSFLVCLGLAWEGERVRRRERRGR